MKLTRVFTIHKNELEAALKRLGRGRGESELRFKERSKNLIKVAWTDNKKENEIVQLKINTQLPSLHTIARIVCYFNAASISASSSIAVAQEFSSSSWKWVG